MKLKLFSFIIVLSLFSIINVHSANLTSGIFSYQLFSDGTAAITGFSGSFSGALTIPYKLDNGTVVKSVAAGAFRGNDSITKLTVEAGVKTISAQAFRSCRSITSITIYEGVTSLAEYSFSGCDAVKTMSLPASLTSIAYNALGSLSSLESIDVADSNSNYLDYNGDLYTKNKTTLLRYCAGKQNTSFVVPSQVTVIGAYAFNDSRNLENITLPSALKSIQDYSFLDCSNLKSIDLPDGLNYIGNNAFNYCTSITEVEIPYTELFGSGIFANCTSLKKVFLNDGVDVVGVSMFYNCSKLRWISIPESVKEIYDRAFLNCNGLKFIAYTGTEAKWNKITIWEGNDVLKTVDFQFGINDISAFSYTENTDDTITITKCSITSGEVVIPDYIYGLPVTSIGANAFYGSRISSIVLPEQLQSIYASAFEYCYGLTDIICPESLKLISTYAFSNCMNLKNIALNEGLSEIGAYAFQGCASLKEITIPSTVSAIRDYAFSYSSALENINVNPNNTSYSSIDGVLLNKSQTTLVQYPMAKRGRSYTLPESVTAVGKASFYNSNLSYVYLSDKVVFINNEAFKNSIIQTIRLPESVIFILNDAFYGCSQLKEVYIVKDTDPWSDITINTGNSYLTNAMVICYSVVGNEATITKCSTNADGLVNIPKAIGTKSVVAIGNGAFQNCGYITEISLPLSIRSIGASAFAYCSLLSDINIPQNVEFIGNNAFLGCNSLKNDVYYGGSQNKWAQISLNTSLTSAAVKYNCIYKSQLIKVFSENNAISVQVIPNSELVGNEIIFVAYRDNIVANVQIGSYKNEPPVFNYNSTYDEIKVMVWNSITDMKPLYEADGYNADEI